MALAPEWKYCREGSGAKAGHCGNEEPCYYRLPPAGKNLIDFRLQISPQQRVHRGYQRALSSSSLLKNSGYEIAAASAPWMAVSPSALSAAMANAIAMR